MSAATLTVAVAMVGIVLSAPIPQVGARSEQRPNVVLILTDDQAAHTLSQMPKTNSLVTDRGASFTDAVVSFPLCCPSRATILTGQYAHNHGVLSNKLRYHGGYPRLSKRHTLPVWLRRAGYRTAHIGKYVNGYGRITPPRAIPPGWSRWWGAPGNHAYRMWGYQLNHNGRLVHHGQRRRDYQTDVYARLGARFIRAQKRRRKPFFLSIATLAPHDESEKTDPRSHKAPRSAPRHQGSFRGAPLPDSPAFDEEDVSDKPPHVARLPRLSPPRKRRIRRTYRGQLDSLLAVDDLVARVIAALSRTGQLRNTYVIFTSDNGYLLGEHRLQGKSDPYEEALRVPLVVRGPGIPSGAQIDGPAANVDLAPTILDLAGAKADGRVDGISLIGAARGTDPLAPRTLLLENLDRHKENRLPMYRGVRDERWVYLEYMDGSRELYELGDDPYELDNRTGDPGTAQVEARLSRRLDVLRDCSGPECSRTPG